MAELTTLEEKLAEVTGLAQAAQSTIDEVEQLVDGGDTRDLLQTMRTEAAETQRRCEAMADSREGKKTAILEKAKETKGEGSEMMKIYLDSDSDGLDGFEFMTMAEAGEVGHWEILGKLADLEGESEVSNLVSWALPIQERHLSDVRQHSLTLAESEAG